MADKKALLLLADSVDFTAQEKFVKKAVVLANASTEGLEALVPTMGGTVVDMADATATFEAGAGFVVVKSNDIETALEVVDRRTLLIVATANAVAFYGLAINAKLGSADRAVTAQDVAVTIAAIADLEIDATFTGGIIYQIMKNPNLKLEEIKKLKEAIVRMESVIERDNREPWEKHDCA